MEKERSLAESFPPNDSELRFTIQIDVYKNLIKRTIIFPQRPGEPENTADINEVIGILEKMKTMLCIEHSEAVVQAYAAY